MQRLNTLDKQTTQSESLSYGNILLYQKYFLILCLNPPLES